MTNMNRASIMRQGARKKSATLLLIAILPLFLVFSCFAENNFYITGTLVSEPCEISPKNQNIYVDFGSIRKRDLYTTKVFSEVFAINLENCNIDIAQAVTISFQGIENTNMSQRGFLALDKGSEASGIAIGIETLDQQFIAINSQSSPSISLNEQNNTLYFNAFIQAETEAINNKKIMPGEFTATATFLLEYN